MDKNETSIHSQARAHCCVTRVLAGSLRVKRMQSSTYWLAICQPVSPHVVCYALICPCWGCPAAHQMVCKWITISCCHYRCCGPVSFRSQTVGPNRAVPGRHTSLDGCHFLAPISCIQGGKLSRPQSSIPPSGSPGPPGPGTRRRARRRRRRASRHFWLVLRTANTADLFTKHLSCQEWVCWPAVTTMCGNFQLASPCETRKLKMTFSGSPW